MLVPSHHFAAAKRADIAGPSCGKRRGNKLYHYAPSRALGIGAEIHHQQIGRRDAAPSPPLALPR